MPKVFIGVGHGGKDPGAVGNGLRESDVNLNMALAMQAELIRHGVIVGISRTSDANDALTEEIAECNAFAPDLAVEVHNNAGGGDGFEVYRQTNAYGHSSLKLAELIETQVKAIGQNSRGVKTRLNGGVDYFGWLRQVRAPAVLCEGAFVDNVKDAVQIDTEAEQRAFGVAYARAVLEYLGIAYKSLQAKPAAPASKLTPITGEAVATAAQMRSYLRLINPAAPCYAQLYRDLGDVEGIRGDVAFAQSCVETGHWRFGGDVKPEQNNFCGLGATGGGEPGCSFGNPADGILAQIQHLKAYANNEPLENNCIDPRFKFVTPRGVAPYVEWLGIPDNPQGKGWAAGKNYGAAILSVLAEILKQPDEGLPDEAFEELAVIETVRQENAELRQANASKDEKITALSKAVEDMQRRFAEIHDLCAL